MISIIHGNDITSSRNYFLQLKKENKDSYTLQDTDVNITDLIQIMDDGSLFQNSKTIFIENFLGEKKKSKEKDEIVKLIVKHAKQNNIFLWEKKELNKSSLIPFKEAIIKNYKLPALLFNFLDSIGPGQGKTLIPLFHKCLENTETEMIFFMIVRQFRILLSITETSEMISEIKRMAPWQTSRLQRQAKLFKKEKLKKLYFRLFEIETAFKTGSNPMPLISVIDIFLAGL